MISMYVPGKLVASNSAYDVMLLGRNGSIRGTSSDHYLLFIPVWHRHDHMFFRRSTLMRQLLIDLLSYCNIVSGLSVDADDIDHMLMFTHTRIGPRGMMFNSTVPSLIVSIDDTKLHHNGRLSVRTPDYHGGSVTHSRYCNIGPHESVFTLVSITEPIASGSVLLINANPRPWVTATVDTLCGKLSVDRIQRNTHSFIITGVSPDSSYIEGYTLKRITAKELSLLVTYSVHGVPDTPPRRRSGGDHEFNYKYMHMVKYGYTHVYRGVYEDKRVSLCKHSLMVRGHGSNISVLRIDYNDDKWLSVHPLYDCQAVRLYTRVCSPRSVLMPNTAFVMDIQCSGHTV